MALSATDLLLGRILSIMENEASLLSGVHDEINELKLELTSMRSFLEDADRTRVVQSKAENDWVVGVREIAHQVEDIIDKYMYDMNRQQQWRWGYTFTSFFLKGIQVPQNLWMKDRFAKKLQDINKEIKSIPERSQRYGVYQLEVKDKNLQGMLGNCDLNWLKNESESSLFLKDDDLVGIKKTQRELLGWLTNGDLERTVISVTGMGGLGKTTLVANTFNKQVVNQHFDFCAWITVSQQYAIEELLRSMIKEIYMKANEQTPVNLNALSYRDLGEKLEKYLQAKRYLIVLDDVWSLNLWQQISRVLPNGRNGSRIMLTTRMKEVAFFQFGIVNHVLELKPLRDKEAWTLFCMKAFPSNLGQCPPYLDSLARNLAEKCKGLPLAIVALGGLLSSKKFLAEWRNVHDNLNWELSNNPELEAVKCILLLSYYHLPYRLKHCFLYCCIFPEDYLIRRNRLIRLWMAEGFVEPVTGATPEVVAERYLTELISRGLLQVTKRNESGRPQTCKMHDILRELAVSISETEKFVAISDRKEAVVVGDNGIHRLSIEVRDKEMKAGKGISKLRSLFVFAVDEISKSSCNSLPSGFKLLRVLDLQDAPINQLPGEVVNLFNLRYLNLTGTQVKELPKSIGKLCNLQSLFLKETQIEELPPGIVKLKNLRHLIVYRFNIRGTDYDRWVGMRLPSNIFLVKSLQVLTFAEAGDTFIKNLSKMTQLKRLCFANVKEANEKDLCFSIGKISLLRYLMVMSCNKEERLKMDQLVEAPPCLEKLVLAGKLEKLPHWFKSLQNLTCLRLHWSRLREEGFLTHIQALPNLGRITLVNAFEGERLCFLQGFQKLKVLRIQKFPGLKDIVINKGVMPGLQELNIRECPKFVKLPHAWGSDLPDLRKVCLRDVSSEIIEQICGAQSMAQPAIRVILLSRVEDNDDESNFKWVYRTYD
ncbi:PREDICTED: disease resistance protein RPM1 [Theobroma cacao]|uniref:Disease resistance protein RPM1 n=1 Tax=Theobroma cacao TaxID=3641 RepID=A0AB32WGI7_THECC|nr:PREDICTED: disease resistance protein RPM1 [Theobroma cacao]XP_017976947.1 PREDICTED: disease resistance protein RPM1 [Theobroma cacao]XP_017976948.1 PREDICTED: disease resistance protein RPM1 [Theobroma cacao]XP_017976949.1 PREDICTED: disease resistance protein RPM1 [Theobroma cacao]XP_017976950.1 PREDICTED: disease resistance protein RPM1 [Theobroma cacao]